MIRYDQGIFFLNTDQTGYIFRLTGFGHPEHIYYGPRPENPSVESLELKRTAGVGGTVVYDESDPMYCLDILPLEWSGIGKGDFRQSPCEIKMPDGTFVTDFVYQSHEILDGPAPSEILPCAVAEAGEAQTLSILLKDKLFDIELTLLYTVFPAVDVITRRAVLRNHSGGSIVIRKMMSMMLDLPASVSRRTTFHGGWIKEAHKQTEPIGNGIYVLQNLTGASGNRCNPGFLISEENASEAFGRVYGFNLVYSGNHYSAIERSHQGSVRVMTGINPHCFEWPLDEGSVFETPEAVLTFSDRGYNGASGQFHDFINRHIVRGNWKDKERPILYNTWESFFFDFTRRKLIGAAKRAKNLGAELFVLDDGWFVGRKDDTAGLGDYETDQRKIRGGLQSLSGRLHGMGMAFGIWVEPEMVNPNSNLFRAHPEYAVRIPGRKESYGRNQLVLDLTNPSVRDYIVEKVSGLLDSADISYVKWDMNRHITDMYSASIPEQGMFFHSYILGLYNILKRVFEPRPHILLESCSSGGNRFDLGMLCFSPQIWASDNTDPVERLAIQSGLSYLYPLSTIGAHVSASPHQQTLRDTPLSNRFNVAGFGVLGYELDPAHLTVSDRKEIKNQIRFYKEHRRLFQFGRFFRHDAVKDNKVHWQVVDPKQGMSIAGLFNLMSHASEIPDVLPLDGLSPEREYEVRTVPKKLSVRKFGGLINHILPIRIDPNGLLFRLIDRFYTLTDCVEQYSAGGRELMQGVALNTPFIGTYYNENTRLMGDYDSNLYQITAL
ncbi:MAG: alpha-galactosidase [Clostridiales bacterium]|nr:alpha-galactosidase [Clostridiales bacterium]